MKKEDFVILLKAVPKAELHLHAEGTISISTVRKFLERNPTPKYEGEKINKLFHYESLKEFIRSFLFIQDLFVEPSDFELLFDDVANYLSNNNIIYCELFFSPSMFLKKRMDFKEILDVMSRKIEQIKAEKNIIIKLIIDISRTFGYENAKRNLELVLKYRNQHIIGIGLGGDEIKGPAVKFKDLFHIAKDNNLHLVAHAGEDADSSSVWDAIKELGAERIGHGIASIKDKELIAYLKETQIPLEICVTSNVFTKKFVSEIEKHPVKQFYEEGILVTINTDDPTFFNTSLVEEYWKIHDKLNFSLSDLLNLVINGFKASFLPDKEKEGFIKKAKEVWNKNLQI
ncbi:MAG: adenosine deaminase [Brevinematia bacterium]